MFALFLLMSNLPCLFLPFLPFANHIPFILTMIYHKVHCNIPFMHISPYKSIIFIHNIPYKSIIFIHNIHPFVSPNIPFIPFMPKCHALGRPPVTNCHGCPEPLGRPWTAVSSCGARTANQRAKDLATAEKSMEDLVENGTWMENRWKSMDIDGCFFRWRKSMENRWKIGGKSMERHGKPAEHP